MEIRRTVILPIIAKLMLVTNIITIINTMYKILLKISYRNLRNKSNRLSTSEINLVYNSEELY